MKVRLLAILVLALVLSATLRGGVSAQPQGWWTLSGNDLYPNSTGYNVGIGTTSPASKFHMVRTDSGAAPGQRFNDAAIFENNGNVFLQLHGSAGGEKSINFAKPTNGADGAIKYNYSNAPDGFGFWMGGNVFRAAITPPGFMWTNAALKAGGVNYTGWTGLLTIDASNNPETWDFLISARNSANSTVFRIKDNGNVGIGIGMGLAPNIITVEQNSSTDPIADAWTVYSSRRWKTNIETLEGALDKVQRLRGVSFDWKETGKHDIGLVAEEVGEVIPEAVAYEKNGVDARSVDYGRLVPVLIQAIKEQEAQITTLQQQVATLEQQVAVLEAEKAAADQ